MSGHITGLPPIAGKTARILILGSIPGLQSLKKCEYYAHPKNTFWSIVCALLNADERLNYADRKQLLIDHQIALWDVLKNAHRDGSLDAKIDRSTIKINHFKSFFEKKDIKMIFFNGGEAEKLFKKYVLATLDHVDMGYCRLPSTSPTHAAMSRAQKLARWRVILTELKTI